MAPKKDAASAASAAARRNSVDPQANPLGHDLGKRDNEGIFSVLGGETARYDPNSRWHRLKKNVATAVFEAPKGTASIYADIPFTHVDWKKHRNAAYRHRAQPMLFLRVAGGFWWHLLYVMLISILVGLWHYYTNVPKGLSSKLQVPFNMTTFALSLLLVFRTNSSYARWWEARMIWGAVVNLSRNFARQCLMWLPPSRARVAVRWAMAAPFLLKCHLRINADPRGNVSHILQPEEVDWLMEWNHKPNCAAHVMSSSVLAGKLDTNRELVLIELVNAYIDCVGKCERIFKTPIPPAYTRHTSRYLMLYLTVMPLVLWSATDWWTPICAMVVCFLLLGTENIGVQIEEPFRVLPLDDMCRGIESALREMERHHNEVLPNIAKWIVDPEGVERAHSSSDSSGPPSPTQGTGFIPPPKVVLGAAELLQRAVSRRTSAGVGHLPQFHLPDMHSVHLPLSDILRMQRRKVDSSSGGADGSVRGGSATEGRGGGGSGGGGVGGDSDGEGRRRQGGAHLAPTPSPYDTNAGNSVSNTVRNSIDSHAYLAPAPTRIGSVAGGAHNGGSSSGGAVGYGFLHYGGSHAPHLPTVSSVSSEEEGEGRDSSLQRLSRKHAAALQGQALARQGLSSGGGSDEIAAEVGMDGGSAAGQHHGQDAHRGGAHKGGRDSSPFASQHWQQKHATLTSGDNSSRVSNELDGSGAAAAAAAANAATEKTALLGGGGVGSSSGGAGIK